MESEPCHLGIRIGTGLVLDWLHERKLSISIPDHPPRTFEREAPRLRSYAPARKMTTGRSHCAVRAFNALCAECGDAGKRYSCAAAGVAPWSHDAVVAQTMALCPGANAQRTVNTFAEMFGWSSLAQDADGKRWTGAADKLHQRSADVKKALAAGKCSVEQLHGALSIHAMKAGVLHGTAAVDTAHTASGECPACAIHFPREYAALQPQIISKGGRPPKKQRNRAADAGAPAWVAGSPPASLAASPLTRRCRSSLTARRHHRSLHRLQLPIVARHQPLPFLALGLGSRVSRPVALHTRLCSSLLAAPHSLLAAAPSSLLAAAASSPADALALALRGERLCVRHGHAVGRVRMRGDYQILHAKLTG
jgi:hypothetical protein